MKKIKVILLLSLFFILTGCQVKYNVNIISGDTIMISEEIFVNNIKNNNLYSIYGYNSYQEMYAEKYSSYYKKLTDMGYSSNSKITDKSNEFKLNREKSLLSFSLNNLLKSNIFETTSIKQKNNIVIFNFKMPSTGLLGGTADAGSYDVNINVPFQVLYNNADKINKRTNTYTWHYSQNDGKDIQLKFDKLKMFNDTSTDIINKIKIVIILLICVTIVITGLIFYHKKIKNNINIL